MVVPVGNAGHKDPLRIAGDVVDRWRAIDAALSPIVGTRGVATLYGRCIFLTARAYPWLSHDASAESPRLDLAPLHALLAGRESAEAAAAGQLLLQTFTELIGRLIGASLAERLLNPDLPPLSSGTAAQDTAP